MGHLVAGGSDNNQNSASHSPGYEASTPEAVPQPEFSAPMPGPQPGFSSEPQSNKHYQPAHAGQQMNFDAESPGKHDDHHQGYDAPDPVKPQQEFSAPILGPQPGFEPQYNMHYPSEQPEQNTQQTNYDAPAKYDHHPDFVKPQPELSAPIPGPRPGFFPEHQSNIHYQPPQQGLYNMQSHYDAPIPSSDQPGYSAPILGPQPGHFAEQHNMHYQPTGQYTPRTIYRGPDGGSSPIGPQVVPTDLVPRQPHRIPDDQKPVQFPQIQMPSYNVPWTTGLFDCFDDPANASITLCVPCVTFGQAAEIIDQGSTTCATHAMFYSCVFCFTVSPCIYSYSYRTKLRAKYELLESPANDFLTHCFCEYCSLCQMHRELVNRGLDPSIGWQANVQRMQLQQQTKDQMAPPPHQAMM